MSTFKTYQRLCVSAAAGLVWACIGPVTASAQSAELDQAIQTALTLSDTKQFDQAIEALEAVSPELKSTYNFRFMRARVLTWSGSYDLAGLEFTNLMNEYPNNPDITVSFAYLEFFRGNLRSAEVNFNKVLDAHPAYIDAYEGLRRTYDLRNSTREISYSALADSVSCKNDEVLTGNGACFSLKNADIDNQRLAPGTHLTSELP